MGAPVLTYFFRPFFSFFFFVHSFVVGLLFLIFVQVYSGTHRCPSTLAELNLASTGASNKGLAAVRDMTLGATATLTSLDVSHNHIDQAGIHAFFEPPQNDMESPRSLRVLILRQNHFTLQSMQTIVSAVKSKAWMRLVALDISLCSVGDIGAGMLAGMLRANLTLTKLNLSGCDLTDNGVRFGGALSLINVIGVENRTIKHLDLSSNTLVRRKLGRFDDEEECGWALVKLIQQNRQIQTLNLKGNPFDLKVRFALKAAVAQQPYAELDFDRKIAFWMCKQNRLGARSPARVLWYGMLMFITEFLSIRRDQGEILF